MSPMQFLHYHLTWGGVVLFGLIIVNIISNRFKDKIVFLICAAVHLLIMLALIGCLLFNLQDGGWATKQVLLINILGMVSYLYCYFTQPQTQAADECKKAAKLPK